MQRGTNSYRGRTATVVGIAITMIAAMICLYLLVNSNRALQAATAEAHLSVMVRDDSGIDPATTGRSIESMAGVSAVTYVDSTVAERDFSASLGVDIQSILGVGSIPSSYIVTIDPAAANRRNVERIKQELASTEWVESVSYEQSLVDVVEKTTSGIALFGRWVMSVAIALILLLLFVITRLYVGVAQNSMRDLPARLLRRALLSRAVVDSVVGAMIGSAIFGAGLFALDRLYPALSLPSDNLPLILCEVVVVGSMANLLFTYISTLKISSK